MSGVGAGAGLNRLFGFYKKVLFLRKILGFYEVN